MGKYDTEKPQKILCSWKKEKERVVLRLPRGNYIKFNIIGSLVFERCNGRTPVQEIVKDIFAMYPDMTKKKIERDVEIFLEDMERKGIIKIRWDPF